MNNLKRCVQARQPRFSGASAWVLMTTAGIVAACGPRREPPEGATEDDLSLNEVCGSDGCEVVTCSHRTPGHVDFGGIEVPRDGFSGFVFEVPPGGPSRVSFIEAEVQIAANGIATIEAYLLPLDHSDPAQIDLASAEKFGESEVKGAVEPLRLFIAGAKLVWPGTYLLGLKIKSGAAASNGFAILPAQSSATVCTAAPPARTLLEHPVSISPDGTVQRLGSSPHLAVGMSKTLPGAFARVCGAAAKFDGQFATLASQDSPMRYRFDVDEASSVRRIGFLGATLAHAIGQRRSAVRVSLRPATTDGRSTPESLFTGEVEVTGLEMALRSVDLGASLPPGGYVVELDVVAGELPVSVALVDVANCREGDIEERELADPGVPVLFVAGRRPCSQDDRPTVLPSLGWMGPESQRLGIKRWQLMPPTFDPASLDLTYQVMGFRADGIPGLAGSMTIDAASASPTSHGNATYAMDASDAALVPFAATLTNGELPREVAQLLWREIGKALARANDFCGLDTESAPGSATRALGVDEPGPMASCRHEQEALSLHALIALEAMLRGPISPTALPKVQQIDSWQDKAAAANCCMGRNANLPGRQGYPYTGCACAEKFPDRPVRVIEQLEDPTVCDTWYDHCTSFYCVACPADRPNFNRQIERCEACPGGTKWKGGSCKPDQADQPDVSSYPDFIPNPSASGRNPDCLYEVRWTQTSPESTRNWVSLLAGFRGFARVNADFTFNRGCFASTSECVQELYICQDVPEWSPSWGAMRGPHLNLVPYGAVNPYSSNEVPALPANDFDANPGEATARLFRGTSIHSVGQVFSLEADHYCHPASFRACSCDQPRVVPHTVTITDVRPSPFYGCDADADSAPGMMPSPGAGSGTPVNPGGPGNDPAACPGDGPPRLRDKMGALVEPPQCACPKDARWNKDTGACEEGDRCLGAEGSKCTPIHRDPALPRFIGVGSCGANHQGPAGPTCLADEHHLSLSDSLQYQSVTLGSIRHDDCCVSNPNGVFCGGPGPGTPACLKEFTAAIMDSMVDGRSWRVLFDRAFTTPAGTRLLDEGRNPTVYARQLLAPGGVPMKAGDAAFCASGKVVSGGGTPRCAFPSDDPASAAGRPRPVGDGVAGGYAAASVDQPADSSTCERLIAGTRWNAQRLYVTSDTLVSRLTSASAGATYVQLGSHLDARAAASGGSLWALRDRRDVVQALALVSAAADGSGMIVDALAQGASGAATALLGCLVRWAAPPRPGTPETHAWPAVVSAGLPHPGLPVTVPLAMPALEFAQTRSGILQGLVPGVSARVSGQADQVALVASQPIVDLRADNNRNGVIDLPSSTTGETTASASEDLDEDEWDATHGAIFLPNVDDDTSRCKALEVFFRLYVECNDAQDDEINGPEDEKDLARILVRAWPAAPDGTVVTVAPSLPDGAPWPPLIRFFVRPIGQAGWTLVTSAELADPGDIAYEQDHSFKLPLDLLRSGAELAIEARDPPLTEAWSGFLDVTLTAAGAEDRVRLRAAPLVFFDPRTDPLDVYIHDRISQALPNFSDFFYGTGRKNALDIGFTAFVLSANEEIEEVAGAGAIALDGDIRSTLWIQDMFQAGYVSMPAPNGGVQAMTVFLHTPRFPLGPEEGHLEAFRLRGPDFGAAGLLGPGKFSPAHSSADAMGNLEVIPPDPTQGTHPVGRLLHGLHDKAEREPPSPSFMNLGRNGPQPLVTVDTTWLEVGHVDEIISFLPSISSPRGWRVLVADPELGIRIVEEVLKANLGTQTYMDHYSISKFVGVVHSQNDTRDVLSRVVTVGNGQTFAAMTVRSATEMAAEEMVRVKDLLKAEPLNLTDNDFVSFPILYELAELGDRGRPILRAITPPAANGLLLNNEYAAPVPHGPTYRDTNEDFFAFYIKKKVEELTSVRLSFIETGANFHVRKGNVHCGTNTRHRIPRPTDGGPMWWNAPPPSP
jgi:protein-arginine deiminase